LILELDLYSVKVNQRAN